MTRKTLDVRDRKIRWAVAGLAVALLVFQFSFKKRLDPEDINNFKEHFLARGQYLNTYAPDFEITCLDGSTFRLADNIISNVVVINFFTTWCGPCRAEMPELQYFVDQSTNRPVRFIAIDVGEKRETVEAFVEKMELRFPVAVDTDERVSAKYRVSAYPTTVLIAPNGTIVHYESGAIANADVTLTPIVNMWAGMLERGMGSVDIEDYLKKAPDRLPAPPDEETDSEGGTNAVAASGEAPAEKAAP